MWSSNLLCISHSIFIFIFCTITFILMKLYESCCINGECGFLASMVIVDRWQRFWSLILEFSCSMGFIVSHRLHLVTSFARMHFYEATRVGKYIQLSYFLQLLCMLSTHLLYQFCQIMKLSFWFLHLILLASTHIHEVTWVGRDIQKTTSNVIFLSWSFKP